MLSLLYSGNSSDALFSSHQEADNSTWILDSRATNHMTFDANDFSHTSPLQRTSIANANGVVSSVTRAGTMTLSPSLTLSNTLLVPSLSHKLLSVIQVTTYLNCIVLIYPTFCLLQDILTKEIIWRGTKRGGLYCMDDFSPENLGLSVENSGTILGQSELDLWTVFERSRAELLGLFWAVLRLIV